MNKEQITLTLNEMKAQFKKAYPERTEEEIEEMILDIFFDGYCNDKMSREDLTVLTMALGYEVNNEVLDNIEKEKKERK